MNNKGQTVTHHYFWMITVVFIFLVCVWIYASNRPDEYNKGSIHVEDRGWSLIEIGKGSCAKQDLLKSFQPLINTVKK